MRTELHTDDIKIEQKPDFVGNGSDNSDLIGRAPEIIAAQQLPKKEYLDELAFNEEPVTIRIEPSAEKNAALWHPIWVNGKGCEVWIGGQWREFTYLPVGEVVTVKRKYVEVLLRSKTDTVQTHVKEVEGENPQNVIKRFTSAVVSFSIIQDKNPLGAAWVEELRRRNF